MTVYGLLVTSLLAVSTISTAALKLVPDLSAQNDAALKLVPDLFAQYDANGKLLSLGTNFPPFAPLTAGPVYADFVHDFVEKLRQRQFGQDSLQTFIAKILNRELATTGEWVEFGCYSGNTITNIADHRKQFGSQRVVHGFDSFIGLPSDWKGDAPEGTFNRNGTPPFEPSERIPVQWHVGWFNETASAFAKDKESLLVGNITFMHMDADLYISTAQAFEALEHRLHPGVIIVFDELIGYPEYQEHEMKAFYELLRRTGRTAQVIGFPGPFVIESPDELRDALKKGSSDENYPARKYPQGKYPQNAMVRLM